MAGKPKRMSQIKQLIRLHQEGKGKKSIAQILGMSKNTVKVYLQKIEDLPLSPAELLALEEPQLEAKFHGGNPAYKDPRYQNLKNQLEYFARELKRKGVTKQLLWKEYCDSHPQGYGYSQFCHHLHQYLKTQHPTMVLEHQPGDKLYIDFAGKKLSYVDAATGEIHSLECFVACLPYSDYVFAMAIRSQRIEDVIPAIVACLMYLGGVPKCLVPDNFKAAVVKAHRHNPTLNQALEDLANHYGITVLPARSGKPKDKSSVENQVKNIYSRVYAPLRHVQFFSLEEVNKAIAEKTLKHNQTRMQQKPYSREEKFIAEEKSHLNALPAEPFELRYYAELTVAKNNHICLGSHRHYYSVPYQYIGKKVKVIYTTRMVRIFLKGQPIAVHKRSFRQGGYTTEKDHLCSQHAHYKDRSPDYYRKRARAASDLLYQVIDNLFKQDRYPEQLYRSCEGLLSLQRKTESKTFDRACEIALAHGQCHYPFIYNLIENNMTEQPELWDRPDLPKHKNTRGKGYYR